MKVTFCGGAQEVSGANHFFETKKTRFLVDCGMFQSGEEMDQRNRGGFPYEAKQIDFVIVSHSHLDHIGRLPLLVKEGFSGKIYATPPTIDFTRLILEDAQHLLEEKAHRAGVLPLSSQKDVEGVMSLFIPVNYEQEIQAGEDVKFTLYEAGHILGSCIISLIVNDEGKEKTIVCSGDLGNYPVPILRAPTKLEKADYILVESAYGDRDHQGTATEAQNILEDVVESTISQGGVLMIPSFAMERTQELLYQLNTLTENKKIPSVPIFIDSPLAIKITRVYKKYEDYFNVTANALIKSGDDIFKFPNLHFTETTAQSKTINDIAPPKIIIAGSGMSTGGRIVHHETRYLSDPRNTLLVVSYQSQGTPGRKLVEGEKKVRILDQEVDVKARVVQMEAYSAHADQEGLMSWLSCFRKPVKKIFVVQGEETAAQTLATKIKDELGIEAQAPAFQEEVEL